MTTPPSGLIATLIAKLDWLSGVGARALRWIAVVSGIVAVAFWLMVARSWDELGVLVLLVSVVPAATLWWYARALAAAVDRTKIEIGVRDLVTKTGGAVGGVTAASKGRFGLIRAGWKALRSVRELRDDIDRLGFDLAAWLTVANPGSLLVAGLAVVAAAAVAAFGVVGIMAKLIL